MTQWYVKDLSKLTKVSVQTLHHYDRIGLLEPSERLPNGYRVYSEKDLLKLQQIVALKFFGFELSQIRKLLSADIDVIEHFSAQRQFLEDKAKTLFDASEVLNTIISDCNQHKSIPWKTIIKLIEVYRMKRELENTWAGKVLSDSELKEFADFEQELPKRFSESEEKKSRKEWAELVSEIHANLNKNPESEYGIQLGKRCMAWVNKLYGPKYIRLQKAVWEKGFKGGHAAHEHGLSSAGVAWLDKAIDAYYRDRIYKILSQIGSYSSHEVLISWKNLINEMCGDDKDMEKELIAAVKADNKISKQAKEWVEKAGK